MIRDKKVLGIIPARGGSKGVPRKNIRVVAGKPLIAWTIEEAKKSKFIDRLILSSNDAEIIAVAREWGCDVPFIRPSELSQDGTPGVEPVIHALMELPDYDYVVMLQPTSPLRSVGDIDGCIEKCINSNSNACVSVVEPDKSPYWMYFLDDRDKMTPFVETQEQFLRRQDLPKVYSLNGAVYVAEKNWLIQGRSFLTRETVGYEMPIERSLDIDTNIDFNIAELLMDSKI
jgi:N-acylneuraminate cytidylyltransferase